MIANLIMIQPGYQSETLGKFLLVPAFAYSISRMAVMALIVTAIVTKRSYFALLAAISLSLLTLLWLPFVPNGIPQITLSFLFTLLPFLGTGVYFICQERHHEADQRGDAAGEPELALVEVGFLQRLLAAEDGERIRNGWAYLLLGLVLPLSFLAYFSQIDRPSIYALAPVALFLGCVLCMNITNMKRRDRADTEKEVWRIWLWLIIVAAFSGLVLSVGPVLNAADPDALKTTLAYVPLNCATEISAFSLVALIATGIVTRRRFFTILTLTLVILQSSLTILVSVSASGPSAGTLGMGLISMLIIFFVAPFLGTGIFFIVQERRRGKAEAHGTQ